MGDLMAGKRGLVMGVANERSIAWGIAVTVVSSLALTIPAEKLAVSFLSGQCGLAVPTPKLYGRWGECGVYRLQQRVLRGQ